MERVFVRSTNIRSVGYTDGVLEVEFLNGSIYQYYSVPYEAYLHMVSYPHPGTYLSHYVKGVYRYARIS